jgi:putative flavoprotein involved in K+ transport
MKETAMIQPETPVPRIPVLVVGGGQAGLSVSWYLDRAGIDHLVPERHRRFHSWRENRWDSFRLVTPNWQCRLPGWPYAGPEPDGFMPRDGIVAYLGGFAASFDPPLRENVAVTRVAPRAKGGYRVETTAGTWTTDQVVIATGGYDTPVVPPSPRRSTPEYSRCIRGTTAGRRNSPRAACSSSGPASRASS